MKKIFITRRLPKVAREILSAHFHVDESYDNAPLSVEKLKEVVSSYDGILSSVTEKFTPEILDLKNNLQVISNFAVGLDNIDLEYAKKRGIFIYNTPNVVTNSTADMTFALLLQLIRQVSLAQEFVRSDNWKSWDPELFLGEELSGKTFGIIGFGKIGKAVAQRARGFDLNVIYHNRSKVDSEDPPVKQVDLDYLLAHSDYISLHVPLSEETKGLIDQIAFNKMARKPILLNMARGGVVNTDHLYAALKSGQVRGACLDVTDPEPISGNHPICNLPNCIVIPHIGTATKECRHNMAQLAAQNIIGHFNTNTKQSSVNSLIREGLKEVFEQVLNLSLDEENISMEKYLEWDSLKHIQLLSAVEKKFGIEIKFRDSLKMTTLQDIMDVVEQYLEKPALQEASILVEDEQLFDHQKLGEPFPIEYNNVYELFSAKVQEDPDKTFAFFPGMNESFSYQEFDYMLLKVANYLLEKKVSKGERINLIIPNSPEFVLLYFAALRLGITVVPINPALSAPEMAYIITQSRSKTVFYDSSLKTKIEELKGQVSSEVEICPATEIRNLKERDLDDSILEVRSTFPKVNLTDEAVIIYTSGTTGNPKGAVLTHLNLLSDAKVISEWFHFTKTTRTLCILPLFHNNGQVITLLTPLYSGGSTVIIQGKASLLAFWSVVDKYNVNWTSVMPSILSILLSMPIERKDTSMRGIICGGQVLTREVQRKFEERFSVPIFEGYGLTETTSFACFNNYPKEKRKEGSVGREFPINRITIRDENDCELQPHQEGEICIRGLNVVNEYFDLEEKNKQNFRDGWFRSGDFGYKDEDGYIYFKTRKDFLIIKGGENIYPSEVENVLFKHNSVSECAVIGIPHPLLGEEVCAFVKLHENGSTTKEELIDFLSGKLAGYKQPKEIIIINTLEDLDNIPKGPTKKILYRKLRAYYTDKYIK